MNSARDTDHKKKKKQKCQTWNTKADRKLKMYKFEVLSQSVIRLLETTKQHFSVLTWKFRILHNFINKRTYLIIFKDEFKITLALDSL